MTKHKINKLLLVSVVVIALILSTFAFVACGNNNKSNLQKPKDIYALAGVSTGAMLQSMTANKTALAGEVEASIVDDLNRYMSVVESLIANDGSNVETTSDRADYKFLQIMTVPNMDGVKTEYKLYYNEVAPKDAVATSDEEDEKETEEAEEEENEYESHIAGIMVIEGKEFPIEGDIEVETEADECEQSIEFVAYTNDSKTDYIKFKNEAETETEDGATENEVEYAYEIYRDNKFVEGFELEVETENGEEEYSIETKDSTGAVVVFELEKEVKGEKTDVKVTYTKNGETGTFKVISAKDKDNNPIYKYVFADDTTIEKDKD